MKRAEGSGGARRGRRGGGGGSARRARRVRSPQLPALLALLALAATGLPAARAASPLRGEHHHAIADAGDAAAAGARRAGPGPGARLLMAQVVFRHGARTPLSTAFYPETEWECPAAAAASGTEPYDGAALALRSASGGPPPPLVDAPGGPAPAGPLPGGCPAGTLTQRGYEMGVELGAALRRRYVDQLALLPPERPAGDGAVYAHSTAYRRTVGTLKVRVGGSTARARALPRPCALSRGFP
jgi:hypothetical protein